MKNHKTLISAETLAGALDNPLLQTIDCRFNLLQPDAGRNAYLEAHIPGAAYAHLDDDLAGPVTPASGRHPLPAIDAIAQFFGRQGVDAATQVVVYDDGSGAIAARAWWLLRWLGHSNVAVLDGGFSHWRSLDLPVQSGDVSPKEKQFVAEPCHDKVLNLDEVIALSEGRTDMQLVDARDTLRFCGEQEPIDNLAGHIPGAVNLPCSQNIGEDGLWRNTRELSQMWSATLQDDTERPFGVMCGSGVTACHLVLSSLIAGIGEPRVYVGSWSEWIRDPGRRVATDAFEGD